MKILQVHVSDYGRGGGNIAMNRLHFGLMKNGVDSQILCANKIGNSSDSITIFRSRAMRTLEGGLRRVTSRLGLHDVHCISTFGLRRNKAFLNIDILHLHCIHGGFFNYLAIPLLTKSRPAVLTLHDQWPFTGHCAVSFDCERWKIGCGKCPYPDTYPSIRRDGTRIEWKLKSWVYSRSNLTVVTPSTWLTTLAEESMLNQCSIHQIPHGVDTKVFQPLDRVKCRSLLGIPPDKEVLMFAAVTMDLSKPNGFGKGGDLLIKAMQSLPEAHKRHTLLLLLGDKGEELAEAVGVEALNLGYISNDRLKAICYSAADLFISSTRAEAFGLVLLESMACGTPMVSFEVGGVTDLVRPGITGYLAKPENAQDLSRGIVQLLEDEPVRVQMGRQCRAIALKEFSLDLHLERHIELYNSILQNGNRSKEV